MISLAMVDKNLAHGTEVTLVWGEPSRGTSKPTVERHGQVEIRATVAPVPISQVAREAYRPKATV
jgi:syringate O-demethylase